MREDSKLNRFNMLTFDTYLHNKKPTTKKQSTFCGSGALCIVGRATFGSSFGVKLFK